MKSHIVLALASLALVACGNNKETNTDSVKTAEKMNEKKFEDNHMAADASFATTAAEGGILEVQLGELAQTNATSPKVKEFGKTMMDDHSKGNEELKTLAQSKKIVLPATLGEANMKVYNDLREKKGNEFDRAYMELMVKDHEDDIKEFRHESEKGEDADIKAWAAGKLPMLEHHLQMAQETQKWVKK